MFKKIIISLCVIFALIFSITFFIVQKNYNKKVSSMKIVTSFYPLYVITSNLLKDTPVEVVPLFSNIKGCIHDISLSTEQLLTLNKAKALIISGAGMESSFIDKIDKSIKIIDTSSSSLLLDVSYKDDDKEHSHHFDHSNLEKNIHKETEHKNLHNNDYNLNQNQNINHKEDHEDFTVNPHYWLSLTNYINQINVIKQGLLDIKELSSFYKIIEKNATTYTDKISQLKKESLKKLTVLKNSKIYFLDEVFKYLTIDLQINSTFIPMHFHMGYQSPSQIFHAIKTIKQEKIKILFTSEDIPDDLVSTLEQDTNVKIYKLYTTTTPIEGDTNILNSYINTYQKNIDIIIKAFSL